MVGFFFRFIIYFVYWWWLSFFILCRGVVWIFNRDVLKIMWILVKRLRNFNICWLWLRILNFYFFFVCRYLFFYVSILSIEIFWFKYEYRLRSIRCKCFIFIKVLFCRNLIKSWVIFIGMCRRWNLGVVMRFFCFLFVVRLDGFSVWFWINSLVFNNYISLRVFVIWIFLVCLGIFFWFYCFILIFIIFYSFIFV